MSRINKHGRAYLMALVTHSLCKKCGKHPALRSSVRECEHCKWRRVVEKLAQEPKS